MRSASLALERTPRRDTEGRIEVRRILQGGQREKKRFRLPVARHITDPQRDSPTAVSGAQRLPGDGQPTACTPRPSEGFSEIEHAGSDEACESNDFAGPDLAVDWWGLRMNPQAARFEHDLANSRQLPFGEIDLFTQHRVDKLVAREAVAREAGDDSPAVAQHCDIIGDPVDLVQLVTDEENGGAVGAELAHHRKEPIRLIARQSSSRLVEDQKLALLTDSAGNFDELSFADRELGKWRVGIGLKPNDVEPRLGRGALQHRGPRQELRCTANRECREILNDREVGKQAQMLVDRYDPRTDGVAHGTKRYSRAINPDLPIVEGERADDNLHQRALTSTILANKSVNSTRGQRQAGSAQRARGTEALDDVHRLQDGQKCCLLRRVRHFASAATLAARTVAARRNRLGEQ